MTHAVHIDHLTGRYHLSRARRGEKQRLDRVLRRVVDVHLPAALEEAGVRPTDELCVREVYVPLAVDLAGTDAALEEAWRRSLVLSFRAELDGGRSDTLLRHPSRAAAFREMACDVVRGDLTRAWAWTGMGLLEVAAEATSREARRQLATALLRAPEHAVAVLGDLAGEHLLGVLLDAWEPTWWRDLALVTLRRAGAESAAELLVASDLTHPDPHPGAAFRPAMRILQRSRIRASVSGHPVLTRRAPVAQALAAIAMLEIEPALARRSSGHVRAVTALVAAGLMGAGKPDGAQVDRPPELTPHDTRHPPRKGRRANGEPNHPAPSGQSRTSEHPTPSPTPSVSSHAAASGAAADENDPTPRLTPSVQRSSVRTAHGGLLFLIKVVEDLGLVERLHEPPFVDRSPCWVLQQLGALLAGAALDDPAVLAFCGLPPDGPPPHEDEPGPADAERFVLKGWCEDVIAKVFEHTDEGRGLAPCAHLAWVVNRPATIAADPGWIDATFSLNQVSTGIRRAGLDLDPGFVPWLGVVVRFIYE